MNASYMQVATPDAVVVFRITPSTCELFNQFLAHSADACTLVVADKVVELGRLEQAGFIIPDPVRRMCIDVQVEFTGADFDGRTPLPAKSGLAAILQWQLGGERSVQKWARHPSPNPYTLFDLAAPLPPEHVLYAATDAMVTLGLHLWFVAQR